MAIVGSGNDVFASSGEPCMEAVRCRHQRSRAALPAECATRQKDHHDRQTGGSNSRVAGGDHHTLSSTHSIAIPSRSLLMGIARPTGAYMKKRKS